jgi:hypothetical protein
LLGCHFDPIKKPGPNLKIDAAEPEKSSTASATTTPITNKAAAARAIVSIVSPLNSLNRKLAVPDIARFC